MSIAELPIHTDGALLVGAGEIFELRLKLQSGHGEMTTTHVRALDLAQATAIGRRYAALHDARFIAVYPFVVADASILDVQTAASIEVHPDRESVEERRARTGA